MVLQFLLENRNKLNFFVFSVEILSNFLHANFLLILSLPRKCYSNFSQSLLKVFKYFSNFYIISGNVFFILLIFELKILNTLFFYIEGTKNLFHRYPLSLKRNFVWIFLHISIQKMHISPWFLIFPVLQNVTLLAVLNALLWNFNFYRD